MECAATSSGFSAGTRKRPEGARERGRLVSIQTPINYRTTNQTWFVSSSPVLPDYCTLPLFTYCPSSTFQIGFSFIQSEIGSHRNN